MSKTIIRNDEKKYTMVNLQLDMRKVFTPYFMDWLHDLCIAMMAEGFQSKSLRLADARRLS